MANSIFLLLLHLLFFITTNYCSTCIYFIFFLTMCVHVYYMLHHFTFLSVTDMYVRTLREWIPHSMPRANALGNRRIIECKCRQETGKIPKCTDGERFKIPKTICQQINKAKSPSAWISRFVNLRVQYHLKASLERNASKNSTFATQVSSALLLGA